MNNKILLVLSLTFFGFIIFSTSSEKVSAGSCTYIGPNAGTWTSASNWSGTCAGPGGQPDDGDDITIPNNLSTINDFISITLNTLTFSGSPGGTLTGADIGITTSLTGSFPHVIDVGITLEGANVSASTNAYNGGIDLNSNTLTAAPSVLPWGVSGVLTGPGTITANDASTIYLSGGASGTVTINASGTTSVSVGGGGWNSSSTVNLSDGATFFGDGSSINTINGDGTTVIRPTDADGTTTNIMQIDNYLGVLPGDTLSFRIAGTTPGSQHDQIFIDNSFEIAGATLALALAYTPTVGDTIVLLEAGDILGTFNGLPDGGVINIGGYSFQITYTSTQIILEQVDLILQFESFTATPTTAAPGEPVTITLDLGGNSGVPTGTVEFFANGVSLGVAVVDGSGVASVTVTNLPSGVNAITAEYSGDGTYPAALSGSAIDVTISGLADTGVVFPSAIVLYGLILMITGALILNKRYEK